MAHDTDTSAQAALPRLLATRATFEVAFHTHCLAEVACFPESMAQDVGNTVGFSILRHGVLPNQLLGYQIHSKQDPAYLGWKVKAIKAKQVNTHTL